MQCEGVVPEHAVIRFEGREQAITDDDTGQQSDQVVAVPVQQLVPETRCDAEATMLARSMQEVKAKGGTAWVTVDDKAYCDQHYQPGVMQHLDGRVTSHPPMAVEAG